MAFIPWSMNWERYCDGVRVPFGLDQPIESAAVLDSGERSPERMEWEKYRGLRYIRYYYRGFYRDYSSEGRRALLAGYGFEKFLALCEIAWGSQPWKMHVFKRDYAYATFRSKLARSAWEMEKWGKTNRSKVS